MKIRELTLYINRFTEQQQFYADVLDLPIDHINNNVFAVQVGWTRFIFVRTDQHHLYHYCFLIPANKLLEAMRWMESKVEIIETEEGKIVFFDTWNAYSFYFYDGAGNIAECIVRHDLMNNSDKPFSSIDFLCINEIGLGTDNIRETNRQLNAAMGTKFWKGEMEIFATNGSQEGLFLLPNYTKKKTWFPTSIVIKPSPVKGIFENQGKIHELQFINKVVSKRMKTNKIKPWS